MQALPHRVVQPASVPRGKERPHRHVRLQSDHAEQLGQPPFCPAARHVQLPEAVRGVDVALSVGDGVQIRPVDVRDADRVVDHLDAGGQVRQGDRLEAAGQRFVDTLHQLVDRDRAVTRQVERRAAVTSAVPRAMFTPLIRSSTVTLSSPAQSPRQGMVEAGAEWGKRSRAMTNATPSIRRMNRSHRPPLPKLHENRMVIGPLPCL